MKVSGWIVTAHRGGRRHDARSAGRVRSVVPTGAIEGFACVPTVEGPIPATDASKPYTAVLQYDVPAGWVDEEYFLSCSTPTITYKTTVIVRKPVNPKQASGIVAVDPLHSAGLWGMMTLLQPYWVDHGDVHVGVVAGSGPLQNFVKPSNPDSLRVARHPRDARGHERGARRRRRAAAPTSRIAAR